MRVDSIEIVLQINGKNRDRLTVPADADKAALEKMALSDEHIKAHLEGKKVLKVICVPGRLVNVVAR